MRCSCQVCGTYMAHAESLELGCVCPECGYLGTNSVLSRDALRHLKEDPAALAAIFTEPEEVPEKYNPDEYGRE